jgi:hypothetical protein
MLRHQPGLSAVAILALAAGLTTLESTGGSEASAVNISADGLSLALDHSVMTSARLRPLALAR